jgi:hypothetical protein
VDVRAQQARENHRLSKEREADAALLREQRDWLVRQLRAEDPAYWTLAALAHAVGCSRELIVLILKKPAPPAVLAGDTPGCGAGGDLWPFTSLGTVEA